jgi:hypothetical protein
LSWRVPARWRLSALGAAGLAVVAALHALWLPGYLWLTTLSDGQPKRHPFVDLHDILLAGQCWRQGVNVYAPSACLGGGVFNYAPALLRLAWLPIGTTDTLVGGLLFCAAYLLALRLLPVSQGRFWPLAAGCFSTSAFYALEQGNLDVLVFGLCLVGVWAQHGRLPARLAGYGLFTACAAAKFYPAALLVLALRERRAVLLALGGAGLVVGLVLAVPLWHGMAAALGSIPSGTPFRATFGRIDLARGMVMLGWLPGLPGLGRAGTASLASWLMAAAALGLAVRGRAGWAAALARLPDGERLLLVAAGAVYGVCFLAAQNVEYREVFLLPALPGLLRLGRTGLVAGILLLLWEAAGRDLVGGITPYSYHPGAGLAAFWAVRELASWWVFTALAGLSWAFAARETGRLRRG